MYSQWQGRSGIGGRESSLSGSREYLSGLRDSNGNGRIPEQTDGTRSWLKEVDDRKSGNVNRDFINRGWVKDPATQMNPPISNGYHGGAPYNAGYNESKVTSLNKANSNLWNRRRTNSTNSIPSLTGNSSATGYNPYRPGSPGPSPHKTTSPGLSPQRPRSPANSLSSSLSTHSSSSGTAPIPPPHRGSRGSSASPRIAHTSGFWVQDPDDIHQMWVKTETPDTGTTASTLVSPNTWPSAHTPPGRSGNGRFYSQPTQVPYSHPLSCASVNTTAPAQHLSSSTSPVLAFASESPNPPPPGRGSVNPTPKVFKSHATWVRNDQAKTPESIHNGLDRPSLMSGAGDGVDPVDVLDFQNRVKIFQPEKSQVSGASRGSTAGSNASQVKRGIQQSTAHSLSSSNLTELKSSSSSKATTTSSTKSSSNLSELKSSISEVKSNISEMTAQSNSFSRSMSSSTKSSALQQSSSSSSTSTSVATSAASGVSSAAAAAAVGFGKLKSSFKSMGSLDALASLGSTEQLALPDVGDELVSLSESSPVLGGALSPLNSSQKELKFEEKKVTSSSKTKVVTDKNSFESASDRQSESRKVQSGDVSYEESSQIAASKSKLELDGITAEKAAASQQEARQLRAGDITLREGSQKKGAAMKISGEGFSAHKAAMMEQQQRQTVTPAGTISQESSRKASKSGLTITAQGVCTKQSSVATSSEDSISFSGFEDLDHLGDFSQPIDIQNAVMKFSSTMSSFIDKLRGLKPEEGEDAPTLLENMNDMIRRAWAVPSHGHELGSSLCNVLRGSGGLDMLLENCHSGDDDLKFTSAKVLEQCLTTENREYVVDNALKTVVEVACDCAKNSQSVDQSRVGTGILEHLFKHSEGTCSDIIKLGGLEAVLNECQNLERKDKTTLQHCAGALANLSLYGGVENHRAMMKQNVEHWLFPLAFHEDENIKYYACLAIAALVANKEIEAAVTKAGTLSLVEPFVNAHLPEEFAKLSEAHCHGQSKTWLQRLVPVLGSKREEARSLAAFHFCMEAGIKKKQGNLDLFREIGAIPPLKKVASSPNAIASKYAAQALILMGEEVPHKLSQQVPLWSIDDVKEWVKQIGFSSYAETFGDSRVDGDLLLRITETNMKEDIGMSNGILRQRFLRELRSLKQITDYSSCDNSRLNDFLMQLDPTFAEYTYPLIQAGVSKDYLRYLKEEQLIEECDIRNSIHRQKICNAIITADQESEPGNMEKDLDVFISYRRSNGSQLASLLKVHMALRGFSTFIDVERLEAGKFDNNLLNSIRQAKHFLLVLTASALERCIGDDECKDWVHREIVAAIQSGCNIIPILDNFQWPEPESLPEDMRSVCYFNGIRWIHDYQDACVDKVERFMRGEGMITRDILSSRSQFGSTLGGLATPGTPSTIARAPPMYQRTTSMESGKGSSCSDKDLSKD